MKIGVIAGAFDVIHPGYIKMFNECKKHCDELHVFIHIDPSVERPTKLKPILDIWDRSLIISSLKQVDVITTYDTEAKLMWHLSRLDPDIRFFGYDYKNKDNYTGKELGIPIHYLSRDHGWSATKFKEKIYEQIKNK